MLNLICNCSLNSAVKIASVKSHNQGWCYNVIFKPRLFEQPFCAVSNCMLLKASYKKSLVVLQTVLVSRKQLPTTSGVSINWGADGGRWRMTDGKRRIMKCGWKNADVKMRMENANAKMPNDNTRIIKSYGAFLGSKSNVLTFCNVNI